MSTPQIGLATGGSRGIGKETALSLARTGFGVILTYQTKADGAQAVVAEIQALGQQAAALQLAWPHLSGIFARWAASPRWRMWPA